MSEDHVTRRTRCPPAELASRVRHLRDGAMRVVGAWITWSGMLKLSPASFMGPPWRQQHRTTSGCHDRSDNMIPGLGSGVKPGPRVSWHRVERPGDFDMVVGVDLGLRICRCVIAILRGRGP
jgi:hypothetical protein